MFDLPLNDPDLPTSLLSRLAEVKTHTGDLRDAHGSHDVDFREAMKDALADCKKHGDPFNPARLQSSEDDSEQSDDEKDVGVGLGSTEKSGDESSEKGGESPANAEKLPAIDLVSKLSPGGIKGQHDRATDELAALFSSFEVLTVNDPATRIDEEAVKLSSTEEVLDEFDHFFGDSNNMSS
jgi:hypothetical protein